MNRSTIRTTLTAAFAAMSIFTASAASAYERWVYIVNKSNSAVWSVEISHVDDPGWGRDLLASDIIPPGYEHLVEPDIHEGYCRFDVPITYDTGYQEVRRGVNLCVVERIYA